MLIRLPPWFRITCAVLALPFVAIIPIAFPWAIAILTRSGPGGQSSTLPLTLEALVWAFALLLIPVFCCLFFGWLALGAWGLRVPDDIQDQHENA